MPTTRQRKLGNESLDVLIPAGPLQVRRVHSTADPYPRQGPHKIPGPLVQRQHQRPSGRSILVALRSPDADTAKPEETGGLWSVLGPTAVSEPPGTLRGKVWGRCTTTGDSCSLPICS